MSAARLGQRGWGAACAHRHLAAAAAASDSGGHGGLLELREYTLKPEGMRQFMNLTAEKCALRQRLLPFLGMFTCDTGGVLNRVLHLYWYGHYGQRDAARAAAAQSAEWQEDYLPHSRLCVSHQESSIFVPDARSLHAAGAAPVQQFRHQPPGSPPPVFELLRYEASHASHEAALADALEQGVRAKLAASPQAQLVYLGRGEVGSPSSALELWRFPSAQVAAEARRAAAAARALLPPLRRESCSLLHPVSFSPMQ